MDLDSRRLPITFPVAVADADDLQAHHLGMPWIRAALEAAGIGVWEFDTLTQTTERSGAYDAIYGYPGGYKGTWDGETCLAHVLPEDRDAVLAEWTRALSEGRPMHLTYRIRRACDGAIRWVEARGMPEHAPADDGTPPRHYVGVLADITDRRAQEEQAGLLLAEMRHRVKNILANVQSLALQTGRRAASLDDFLQAFGGRLNALAHAHDIAAPQDGSPGASVAAVIRAALEPWEQTGQIRLAGGEHWRVTPRQAVALSLGLHELATNAVKYGALSCPTGRVTVTAAGGQDRLVSVTWKERGGPPPQPGTGRGFGSRLLVQALPQELDGTVALTLPTEGARCAFRFPATRATAPPAAAMPVWSMAAEG